MKECRGISIKTAATIMGKSHQFIRIGLQRQLLPFGSAVKLSTRWTYYISPRLFCDYVGLEEIPEEYREGY